MRFLRYTPIFFSFSSAKSICKLRPTDSESLTTTTDTANPSALPQVSSSIVGNYTVISSAVGSTSGSGSGSALATGASTSSGSANGSALATGASTTPSVPEISSSSASSGFNSSSIDVTSTSTTSGTSTATTSSATTTSSTSTTSSATTTSSTITTSSTTTTSSTSTSTSSQSVPSAYYDEAMAEEVLEYHNHVRVIHGVPQLSWNVDAAEFAKYYLDNSNCVFAHSTDSPFGENIAYATPFYAMQAWYAEWKLYDYSAGEFSGSTGNFTQMVWKDTTSIGCAIRACPNGDYFVCEYDPRGNVPGEFTDNVFPADYENNG